MDLPAPLATKYTKPAVTDDVEPEPAIFTNHNGIQLTQEQIDAEAGDAEEENGEGEKDADMANNSGQRQEAEPGDTARNRFLREGANNVMDVLK
ncbi:hypothetical protein CBER1_11663 [Cercospora berteroae]|uniref:Uncharacterized protein n=1 Tax=Cercospora berteroae TaxID=357750 RepID=A0A2S6BZQ1_9PEZI|nr:hypothetical protein CBER1_11663 [Cercospora berteroae]